ncbi:hypothetical protein [Streptomyces sp. NBC_01304]|uniref:hypothetical protein n=1 Tax=Streptomyces sp. NBC_01304 TaxID=2903818 RepID=UPI002E0FFDC0|nr:hypothetical protein OG430_48865 [Streptomyces sp. NBC_01304]
MSAQNLAVALAHDGRSWVDGVEVRAHTDGTLSGARAAALNHVARIARQRRRPVRVNATEPDGHVWHFVVGPDGEVVEPHAAHQLPDDPDARRVPPELAVRVATVNEAISSDRHHIALKLAQDLDAELADQHGLDHPHALRARELRAHAAYRAGLVGEACELYLDAARGWHQLASDAYWDAVQRAYALWHQVQEDSTRIVWLGDRLVEILELGDARADATAAAARQRIDQLRLGEPTV